MHPGEGHGLTVPWVVTLGEPQQRWNDGRGFDWSRHPVRPHEGDQKMVAHRVIRRANKRAQRRFHVACVRGVAVDGNARETRLWIEAERLLERLEWAEKRRRYDAYQLRDMVESESELREAWGK